MPVSKDFSEAFEFFTSDIQILKRKLAEKDAELVPIDDLLEKKLLSGFVQYVNSVQTGIPNGTEHFNGKVKEFVKKHTRSPGKTKIEKEREALEEKIKGAENTITNFQKRIKEEKDHNKKSELQEKLTKKESALRNLETRLQQLE